MNQETRPKLQKNPNGGKQVTCAYLSLESLSTFIFAKGII